jgi:ketosteroid isomerase-like protein
MDLTSEQVSAWVDAYVDAWQRYDPAAIGTLFSDDATYRYRPYLEPLRGRDAIVADWLADRDEPGSWQATYRPLLVDGDRAIVTGETQYADGERFSNLFVLRFDGEGRCRELTEWYMEHQPA